MLDEKRVVQLWDKFVTGVLDTELLEKTKIQNPHLEAKHFRFLTVLGVKDAGEPATGQDAVATGSTGESAAAQLEDVQKVEEKRLIECDAWTRHLHKVNIYHAASHAATQDAKDKVRSRNREVCESEQESRFPLRVLSNSAHAPTFIQSSVQVWCDSEVVDKAVTFQVYYSNSTISGYDCLKNVTADTEQAATHLAEDPENSVFIVAAPNTGPWGNEYNEDDIRTNTESISQMLRFADRRMLVREFVLQFDEGSLHGNSQRPSYHKFWICISDQQVDGKPRSRFTASLLWRRLFVNNVHMLPHKDYVNPMQGAFQKSSNDIFSLENKAIFPPVPSLWYCILNWWPAPGAMVVMCSLGLR